MASAAHVIASLPQLRARPSVARARRAGGRASRRWTQYAAAALALGLGLNGIVLCLCAPGPTSAPCDPRGCCPVPTGHHTSAPEPAAVVTPSQSCCAAHWAPDLAARLGEREVVLQSLTTAAATHVSLGVTMSVSRLGTAAPSFSSPSRTRSPILRI